MHKPIAALHEIAVPEVVPHRQHVLHRDYETRCADADLRVVGAHRYAANPRTEIVCAAYAVDDGLVRSWLPGDPVPAEFIEAARKPDWKVAAHNDAFEFAIEQYILAPRYGFPPVPLERHVCTQAACLAAGLPAKLGSAADALELANRKDVAGERLMHAMAKPRRPHKDEPAGLYWFEDQERLERLRGYNKQDTEVERELHDRVPELPRAEQALWVLSCRINNRGFHVDRGLAASARRVAQQVAPEIDAELAEITGDTVTGINQIARLQAWLRQQGCAVETLDKKAVEKLLAGELAAPARRVLELRASGAQAAVKKINALLARAGDGDRVRGAFRYHGAATGRWSGEGFQPQNLKRPAIEDIDAAIAAVSTGNYARVKELYERPLAVVGDCSRSMIAAAPGHTLIGADFGSIESRVLAWIAGEEWKLEAYRRFDVTHDAADEPYRATAALIFHTTPDAISKEQRGVGKICDLAFGYMGGLGAWRNFEPERFTDQEVEQFKTEWRVAHPRIKQFWHSVDRAAWTAVRSRGRVVQAGRVAFKCTGAFLQLKLPSGRKLFYPQPRIEIEDLQHQVVLFADNAAGQFKDCRRGNGAYGGLWVENIVSGIARDLLAEAMLRIEAAGYPIVLHVHDELVAEVSIAFGSTEEFTQLMTQVPTWAPRLPIAASAWSGPRYRK